MATVKLTLPLPMNRANARWHWATEMRIKRSYYDKCLVRYGKIPKTTMQRAKISVKFFLHQKMDDDNLRGRLKWPLDWLVIRGFIKNDSPDVLVWGPVTQEVDRKDKRIEIEIKEVV